MARSNGVMVVEVVSDTITMAVMSGTRKRQRRQRRREETENEIENGNENDPMEVLGEDIMMRIMGCLDARSLCKKLWIGKAHIPRWSKVPGLSKLACYSRAVTDSKRIRIMREDLCDHSWDFHFTEAAPAYWKNLDPYWGGSGSPMHRYFHADGSQTADPDDKVWGGHECTYTIVTSIVGDGKIRENYVRINRRPRLAVSRRDDWGWEMSNVIFAYSSVPDAHKDSGTGPMF